MAGCLGIDVGGGAARWRLASADGAIRTGLAPGFSGHLYLAEIRAAAEASLRSIAGQAGPADAVVAGVTGLTAPSSEAAALRAIIAEAFGARDVAVMSDSRLAYLSAFAPGAGLLVYAGTGSVAIHVGDDGSSIAVGGRGVIIDDAGGGYWIATRALRSVLRREDASPGSAWPTPLGRALGERLGGVDWPTVRQAIYGSDRGAIGAVAVAVAEAARSGDASAEAVLASAGRELAALALSGEGRVGPKPIALAGGAAHLHPTIFAAFADALGRRDASLIRLDPAAGAARLAADALFWSRPEAMTPH